MKGRLYQLSRGLGLHEAQDLKNIMKDHRGCQDIEVHGLSARSFTIVMKDQSYWVTAGQNVHTQVAGFLASRGISFEISVPCARQVAA